MKIRLTSFTLLFLFMNGCLVQRGGSVRSDPGGAGDLAPAPRADAPLEVFQSGVASWYGADFHGKLTADGETYDMDRLTAAHQTLPFHTFVEVENLENGRRVVVRINDRGPFLKNRVIDLSRRAAERIGMLESGTAAVRLRIIAAGAADVTPPLAPAAGVCLQLGAFAGRENADARLREVRSLLPDLFLRVVEEGGLFKVVTANLAGAEAARQLQQQLDGQGIASFARDPLRP